MDDDTGARGAPSLNWAFVDHGGAGTLERADLKPRQERAYRDGMSRAAEAAAVVLRGGGRALDAVETAVRLLEDDPLFNAGRGSVFTTEGLIELDAAIMDGLTLSAGAVAGVQRTRNPISLARAVMERSAHVFLVGEGAEAFSRYAGLEQVEPGWFFTERRWTSLARRLAKLGLPVPPRPAGAQTDAAGALAHDEGEHGTVGAVALDMHGDLAAATSTGGTTAKLWGRVGDSPIIGAGTYASNRACAVSATGTGEYFIRLAAAKEICALVEYKGLGLQAAVDAVVQDQLGALGGDGGVIAVGWDGSMAWSYNTGIMHRVRIGAREPLTVGIYRRDP
jgi:beta-aspartyl-peptidase (threonine type)